MAEPIKGNLSAGLKIDSRQYEALFNNAIIGIVLTNQFGEIVHINRFAEKQFGYQWNELIGKPVELLIPRQFRGMHTSYRQGFYHHPQTRIMGEGRDLHALRKDGTEFPAEISLSHYELEGQNFVIAFIVDITVRKNAEELLRRQKTELERVYSEIFTLNQELEIKVKDRTMILHETLLDLEKSREELKMSYEKEKELGALKSRFVSMASHEFRTPLSTILSSAALIQRYSTPDQTAARDRHIEKIQNAVKVLNDILEDFLSLGKLEEGQVAAKMDIITKDKFISDINDLIQEINQASNKKHFIKINYALQSNEIIIDKKLLRNIVTNLVSNAIKYSPENSTIMIECKDEPGNLQISVTDEGIGISEEDQQHLFERFYRAGNTTNIQGTGLGLHIVGRYLALMDGSITVSSKLNEGTTIRILIPQPKKI